MTKKKETKKRKRMSKQEIEQRYPSWPPLGRVAFPTKKDYRPIWRDDIEGYYEL